jgi:hypothetical protein
MHIRPEKPKRKSKTKIMVVIFCLGLIFFPPKISEGKDVSRSFEMGLIYWPPHDLKKHHKTVETGIDRTISYSDIMVAQIPWSAVDSNITKKSQWIASLARKHGRRLIIALDWLEPARKNLRDKKKSYWSFSDDKISQLFLSSVLSAARAHKPEYFLLGVEVNYLALNSPKEFRAFLTIFQKTRELIKRVSPKTLVSVSFQYELLIGSDLSRKPIETLEVVNAFGKSLDIVGFSLYPHLTGLPPDSLGTQYLNKLRQINQPIGIFETAWPTDSKVGSKIQKQYLQELLPQLNDIKTKLVVWTSSTDSPNVQSRRDSASFGIPSWAYSLGLWTIYGEPKPAASIWTQWFQRLISTTIEEKAK